MKVLQQLTYFFNSVKKVILFKYQNLFKNHNKVYNNLGVFYVKLHDNKLGLENH